MVHTAEEPNTPIAFDQLPLSPETLTAIEAIGYQYATPVQAGAIPPAIDGRDLMVQSQTGTGKTAAFSLPLIERLKGSPHIGALALAPTRELARQVMEEARRLSAHSKDFSVTCIYGGVSFDDQVSAIKQNPTLVVGTPGRVLDHLRRGTLSLKALQCFVLDEADEMLSMGFAEDLEDILRHIPKERQTLFFSATFPATVKRYANKTLQNPISLSFLDETSSADDLEHYYMLLPGVARSSHLKNLLLELNPESALIFTNTRRDADKTAQLLNRHGLDAHKLSGDMDQNARDRVMQKMKAKQIRFLVATDVAARGIDISQLSHVFHYQLPDNPEVYIHRSGRTGRAGAKGVVYSLASSKDLGVIYALKRFHNLSLTERALPKAIKTSPVPRSTPFARFSSADSTIQGSKSASDIPKAKRVKTNQEQVISGPASSKKSESVNRATHEHNEQSQNDNLSNKKSKDTVHPPSATSRERRRKTSHRSQAESVTKVTQASSQNDNRVSRLFEYLESGVDESIDFKTSVADLSNEEKVKLAQRIDQSNQTQAIVTTLLEHLIANTHSNQNRAGHSVVEHGTKSEKPKPSRHKRQSRVSHAHEHTQTSETPQKQSVRAWLTINLGWRDINGGHSAIKEAIAELGGLLIEDIQQLKVKEHSSLLLVEEGFEEDLITAINGESFQSKTLSINFNKHN